jgi:hypothetical protein
MMLAVLALYYAGMVVVRHNARLIAASHPPGPSVISRAVWPAPANPLVWTAVAQSGYAVHTKLVRLNATQSNSGDWRELPALSPEFLTALRRSDVVREFLNFARYTAGKVEEQDDGFIVRLKDIRFNLEAVVHVDRELTVKSAEVSWF